MMNSDFDRDAEESEILYEILGNRRFPYLWSENAAWSFRFSRLLYRASDGRARDPSANGDDDDDDDGDRRNRGDVRDDGGDDRLWISTSSYGDDADEIGKNGDDDDLRDGGDDLRDGGDDRHDDDDVDDDVDDRDDDGARPRLRRNQGHPTPALSSRREFSDHLWQSQPQDVCHATGKDEVAVEPRSHLRHLRTERRQILSGASSENPGECRRRTEDHDP